MRVNGATLREKIRTKDGKITKAKAQMRKNAAAPMYHVAGALGGGALGAGAGYLSSEDEKTRKKRALIGGSVGATGGALLPFLMRRGVNGAEPTPPSSVHKGDIPPEAPNITDVGASAVSKQPAESLRSFLNTRFYGIQEDYGTMGTDDPFFTKYPNIRSLNPDFPGVHEMPYGNFLLRDPELRKKLHKIEESRGPVHGPNPAAFGVVYDPTRNSTVVLDVRTTPRQDNYGRPIRQTAAYEFPGGDYTEEFAAHPPSRAAIQRKLEELDEFEPIAAQHRIRQSKSGVIQPLTAEEKNELGRRMQTTTVEDLYPDGLPEFLKHLGQPKTASILSPEALYFFRDEMQKGPPMRHSAERADI